MTVGGFHGGGESVFSAFDDGEPRLLKGGAKVGRSALHAGQSLGTGGEISGVGIDQDAGFLHELGKGVAAAFKAEGGSDDNDSFLVGHGMFLLTSSRDGAREEKSSYFRETYFTRFGSSIIW